MFFTENNEVMVLFYNIPKFKISQKID